MGMYGTAGRCDMLSAWGMGHHTHCAWRLRGLTSACIKCRSMRWFNSACRRVAKRFGMGFIAVMPRYMSHIHMLVCLGPGSVDESVV